MSTFTKRLKQIRKERGLTQEKLGILVGIDEFSASTRMNHYEVGRHEPNIGMIEKLGKILNVHPGYFFSEDDIKTQILCKLPKLKKPDLQTVLALLEELEMEELEMKENLPNAVIDK